MSSRLTGPAEVGSRGAGGPALSAGLVAAGTLLILAVTSSLTGWSVFTIPFIATAAVISMAPNAPLARPAAIVMSYPAAVITALVITAAVGPSAYAATAAVALSIVVMVALRAPHAPAAAAAALIGLSDPGFVYVLDPLVPALVIVVGGALLAGHVLPQFPYATSWR